LKNGNATIARALVLSSALVVALVASPLSNKASIEASNTLGQPTI